MSEGSPTLLVESVPGTGSGPEPAVRLAAEGCVVSIRVMLMISHPVDDKI